MAFSLAYLAVPYSHDDPAVMEARYRAVTHAAKLLFRQGRAVFSPITHSHPIADTGAGAFEVWRDFDLHIIRSCDRVLVLPLDGWEQSVGVAAEIEFAKSLDIPVEVLMLHKFPPIRPKYSYLPPNYLF